MSIQSLSILVPCGDHCWNNCSFCVSRAHSEDYGQSIITANNIPQSYLDRVQFARDAGCDSLILTGTTEPQQNLPFIYRFLNLNRTLRTPFYNITIQTTGSGITQTELERMSMAGINTLALSVSSFDDITNWNIIHTPGNKRILSLVSLISYAKYYNMNVRLCVNLTDAFINYRPANFFEYATLNHVDQLTFRKIYSTNSGPQADWIAAHEFPEEKFKEINNYVCTTGKPINRLPFGAIKYDVNGISTVVDDDCMSQHNIEEIRYYILRDNGHLYSRWDSTASLIF